MKKIVAVDIDDVLSRTAQSIIDFGNHHWGHTNTLEDFTEQLSQMWQVDIEEAHERWEKFMNSGIMEQFDVIPEAKEVLEKLAGGYTLIVVTSRRDVLLDITHKWLDANYPGVITEVVGVRIYGEGKADAHMLTKAEVLQELGADYLIDDQPKHCIGAAEVGVKAVLYGGYPWNKDVEILPGVTRCDTWQSVLEYFDGQD